MFDGSFYVSMLFTACHRVSLCSIGIRQLGSSSPLCVLWVAVGKQLKRRSEVDRRLEQLVQKQSFKLKEPGQQSVIKVHSRGDSEH